MRRRKLNGTAKKPAILKKKIILAQYIKANWEIVSKDQPAHGYYWNGTFAKEMEERNKAGKVIWRGKKYIYIYFQRYVQRPDRVDYIRMQWVARGPEKNLSPKEIDTLIQTYVYGTSQVKV